MVNEFGQEIPDEKLEEFSERLSKLIDKDLDKLFREVGFFMRDREEYRRALRDYDLRMIREGSKSRRKIVENLLLESDIEEFEQSLERIEEQNRDLKHRSIDEMGLKR